MIQLTRIRTENAVNAVFRGAKRKDLNKKLLLSQRAILNGAEEKHLWNSNVWGESRSQLLKESANKCAYCEAPLKVVAYGDVEHYRPKSIYWWLAYSYENYLASCTLCNQQFKKDFFPKNGNTLMGPPISAHTTDAEIETLASLINPDPLNDALGMPQATFIAAHDSEQALLPNPYYEDPEKIFSYVAHDDLAEVDIVVLDTVANAQHIEKAVVTHYGLNRLELRQLRYEWYDFYIIQKLILKEVAVSAGLKQRAQKKIQSMMLPKSPFAGMIRYFERSELP